MTCTICQEDICSSVVTLSCGHSFHPDCIVEWLRKPHSMASCPNCRHVERDDDTLVLTPTQDLAPPSSAPDAMSLARKLAARYKRLKNLSSGAESKANTFRKWDKYVKILSRQNKAYLLQLKRQNRAFKSYRQSLMKKATIMVERQVWSLMKSSGHLEVSNANNSVVKEMRKAKKNLDRAKRTLLALDHQA